jgi:putative transposase
MPAHKKQDTTSHSNGATSNEVPPDHQKPLETFHQYLRSEIRHATRMVMEEVMREELNSFLGANWGECTHSAQRLSQRLLHAGSDDHLKSD